MKKLTGLFAFFISISAPAFAQVDFSAVVSAVSADFNGDSSMDRAVLVQRPVSAGSFDHSVDLYLYLSAIQSDGSEAMNQALVKQNISCTGRFDGNCQLRLNSKSSLILDIEQDYPLGAYNETNVTVDFANGDFRVIGFTFERNSCQQSGQDVNCKDVKCDLNLLTGQGVLSSDKGPSKKFKSSSQPLKFGDWTQDTTFDLPKSCQP